MKTARFIRAAGETVDLGELRITVSEIGTEHVALDLHARDPELLDRAQRKANDWCAKYDQRFEEFVAFHRAYPEVYEAFVAAVRERVRARTEPEALDPELAAATEQVRSLAAMAGFHSRGNISALQVLREVRRERRKESGRGTLPLKNEFSVYLGRLARLENFELRSFIECRQNWYDVSDERLLAACGTKRRSPRLKNK